MMRKPYTIYFCIKLGSLSSLYYLLIYNNNDLTVKQCVCVCVCVFTNGSSSDESPG